MNYIKARFNNSQKSYTYRTEDDVKPGDIVVDKRGAKLTVIEEAVDMARVEANNDYIAEVKKYVEPVPEKTFDEIKADAAQRKYCIENNLPHFAPSSSCYRCHQNIYAETGKHLSSGRIMSGISVEKAGRELITGCPFCNWSYCD